MATDEYEQEIEMIKFLENQKLKSDYLQPSTTSTSNMAESSVQDGQKEVNRSKLICYYCGNSHEMIECKNFTNNSKMVRKEKLMKTKLCLNYLRSEHISKGCTRKPCALCKQHLSHLLHDCEVLANHMLNTIQFKNGQFCRKVEAGK